MMASAYRKKQQIQGQLLKINRHSTIPLKRWISSLLAIVTVTIIALSQTPGYAATINVNSITALNSTIAGASAGDVIILADGTYSNQGLINFDARSINPAPTSDLPIIVRAQTPGGVIITGGSSGLSMRGSHLIFAGFHFRDITADGVLIELVAANYCRLTNCNFERVNKTGGVIEVRGLNSSASEFIGSSTHNRIDHCTFDNNRRVQIENFIVNHPRYVSPDLGNIHNTYDHLHFINHVEASQEEAFQIGRGSDGYEVEFATDAYTTVEYNLFENYDGDNELISNKSSSNTFRHNVVINCMGALQIRGGDDCVVDANFFYEDGSSNEQYYKGILAQGTGHRITNNYVEGNVSAIGIRYGNSSTRPDAANIIVANNTIRNTNRGYIFVTGDPVAPVNISFYNNVGESSVAVDPMFGRGYGGTGHIWSGNRGYVSGGSLRNDAIPSSGVVDTGGFELVNQRSDYLVNYRYPQTYHAGINFNLSLDIEGRERNNPPRVGAFEGPSNTQIQAMLTRDAAGTDWSVIIPDSDNPAPLPQVVENPTNLRIVSP